MECWGGGVTRPRWIAEGGCRMDDVNLGNGTQEKVEIIAYIDLPPNTGIIIIIIIIINIIAMVLTNTIRMQEGLYFQIYRTNLFHATIHTISSMQMSSKDTQSYKRIAKTLLI